MANFPHLIMNFKNKFNLNKTFAIIECFIYEIRFDTELKSKFIKIVENVMQILKVRNIE